MRAKEIRERSDDELLQMKEDAETELFRARLQNAIHQLDNTGQLKAKRRDIARINTVLRERANSASSASTQSGEE
jgi:large subunit ribosomal protein L29